MDIGLGEKQIFDNLTESPVYCFMYFLLMLLAFIGNDKQRTKLDVGSLMSLGDFQAL